MPQVTNVLCHITFVKKYIFIGRFCPCQIRRSTLHRSGSRVAECLSTPFNPLVKERFPDCSDSADERAWGYSVFFKHRTVAFIPTSPTTHSPPIYIILFIIHSQHPQLNPKLPNPPTSSPKSLRWRIFCFLLECSPPAKNHLESASTRITR